MKKYNDPKLIEKINYISDYLIKRENNLELIKAWSFFICVFIAGIIIGYIIWS